MPRCRINCDICVLSKTKEQGERYSECSDILTELRDRKWLPLVTLTDPVSSSLT